MASSRLAGKLTAAKRSKLNTSSFALPDQKKYPVTDDKHAQLAKSYAKKNLARGKLTEAQYNQIVTRANRKLSGG